jgi:AbrB family looped-hinge helix DNA binding protein
VLLTSKLTAKAQTTIPREVRDRLGLAPGDSIVYEVDDEGVRLRRLAPADVAYLRAVQATLSEWDSPEDDAAYAGL